MVKWLQSERVRQLGELMLRLPALLLADIWYRGCGDMCTGLAQFLDRSGWINFVGEIVCVEHFLLQVSIFLLLAPVCALRQFYKFFISLGVLLHLAYTLSINPSLEGGKPNVLLPPSGSSTSLFHLFMTLSIKHLSDLVCINLTVQCLVAVTVAYVIGSRDWLVKGLLLVYSVPLMTCALDLPLWVVYWGNVILLQTIWFGTSIAFMLAVGALNYVILCTLYNIFATSRQKCFCLELWYRLVVHVVLSWMTLFVAYFANSIFTIPPVPLSVRLAFLFQEATSSPLTYFGWCAVVGMASSVLSRLIYAFVHWRLTFKDVTNCGLLESLSMTVQALELYSAGVRRTPSGFWLAGLNILMWYVPRWAVSALDPVTVHSGKREIRKAARAAVVYVLMFLVSPYVISVVLPSADKQLVGIYGFAFRLYVTNSLAVKLLNWLIQYKVFNDDWPVAASLIIFADDIVTLQTVSDVMPWIISYLHSFVAASSLFYRLVFVSLHLYQPFLATPTTSEDDLLAEDICLSCRCAVDRSRTRPTPCGHVYHLACLASLLRSHPRCLHCGERLLDITGTGTQDEHLHHGDDDVNGDNNDDGDDDQPNQSTSSISTQIEQSGQDQPEL